MVSSCDQRTQLPRKTLPKSVLENHSDSKLSSINDARARKRQRESQLEFKILKTTGLIVMLFFLLVFPRIVVIIYSVSAGNDMEYVIHARLWMRILLYCNSAVNPFLYSLRHREIWHEFMKLVRCCYWGTGRRHARAWSRKWEPYWRQSRPQSLNYFCPADCIKGSRPLGCIGDALT